MNEPQPSPGVPAHLRRRLAMWVGGAAFIGGAIGYFTGHSERAVVGGALLTAAAVLVVSWIDRMVDWAQRVLRVMRATLIGFSLGAIAGVAYAVISKGKWLGPLFTGALIGAVIAMVIWTFIERDRARKAREAELAAAKPPASPRPGAWPPGAA